MIRRMRRMNESRVRRPSAVETMMDDIDYVYDSDVLGVKPSKIADILGKNNASEDDSGIEGYFATMSNSDIEKAWFEIKEYLQAQLSAGRELDSEVCFRFEVEFSKSDIANMYRRYQYRDTAYGKGFCAAVDMMIQACHINIF